MNDATFRGLIWNLVVGISQGRFYSIDTAFHAEQLARVQAVCGQVSPFRELPIAALLHDIGKLLIPKEILHKPGKLSSEEFVKIMQKESGSGFNPGLLQRFTRLRQLC